MAGPTPASPALLGPSEIRTMAARLGLRPSRRLGQNFVVDPGTVTRITALAALDPDDVVLEVGPGLGSLTLPLLGAARQVIAVELDPVLAAELPRTVAARAPGRAGRLEVLAADAARVAGLPGEPPDVLVANLPYNAAVPVLLHLLATFASLRRGLVMVQAEVAERMAAPPGSRSYGVPSVKLAWYGTARRAGSVPRSVFWPVPRVDSGLVAFARHPAQRSGPGDCEVPGSSVSPSALACSDRVPGSPGGVGGSGSPGGPGRAASREEVFAVIDAAFSQRRKTLRSALAAWAGSAARAELILRAAGISPALRGEALGVIQFARIAVAANALRGKCIS